LCLTKLAASEIGHETIEAASDMFQMEAYRSRRIRGFGPKLRVSEPNRVFAQFLTNMGESKE
jgi:hypothetical protein